MSRRKTPLSVKIPRYLRYFRDLLRGYAMPHGVRIPFDRSILTYTMRKIISRGDYETDELMLSLEHIRPDSRILELGGGIGYVSAMIQSHRPGAHVTSFEANPIAADLYKRVMSMNGLTNYELHNAIMGDASKGDQCTFHVSPEFWASSTHRSGKDAKSITVPVVDGSAFLKENSFDILIADIEGGESELVELLDRAFFPVIVMELHADVIGPDKTARLLDRLEALGYRLSNGDRDKLPSVCVFRLPANE